jgi:hypothetical protein
MRACRHPLPEHVYDVSMQYWRGVQMSASINTQIVKNAVTLNYGRRLKQCFNEFNCIPDKNRTPLHRSFVRLSICKLSWV